MTRWTVGPRQLAELVAIPGLSDWVSHMTAYGEDHAYDWDNEANTSSDYWLRETGYYYDAARVFFQIADYTDNNFWSDYAAQAASIYITNHVNTRSPPGNVYGYQNQTHGFRMDWERNGTQASKDAAILLSTVAQYASDSSINSGYTHATVNNREASWALMSRLNAEALGENHRATTDQLLEDGLFHVEDVFVTKEWRAPANFNDPAAAASKYYIQPFMWGIKAQSLIQWWEEKSQDNRIPTAVAVIADWLWDNMWDQTEECFLYHTWADSGTEPLLGYESGVRNWAPDLNNLISPLYAWLYKETLLAKYRDRGDAIFLGGSTTYGLDMNKQFNQNYSWAFQYPVWRAAR